MTFTQKLKLALRLLFTDPALTLRILSKRYTRNSWIKKDSIPGKVKSINFNFDLSLSRLVSYMYTGSYEVETYLTLKKILKPGDTFIDVGANIGYISALALGIVGKKGEVHAFEPIKKYFSKLEELKSLNEPYSFIPINAAAGQESGSATITINKSENIGNNSLLAEAMPQMNRGEEVEINLIHFGNYLKENDLFPRLIKIDTEGYELNVLRSIVDFINGIEKNDRKPSILCEVTPEVYPQIGESIQKLSDILNEINYAAYALENLNKEISLDNLNSRVDVVFKTKV